MNHRSLPQRGIALIEALVSLLIVALVLLAAMQFVQRWRVLGDVSRERTEATRLADAELERVQSLGDAEAVAALADRDEAIVGRASTARFQLQRRVDDRLDGVRGVTVALGWTDRTGAAQRVEIPTLAAPHDARLSAALIAAGTAASAPRAAFARHPGIPPSARDLGDGRSAYAPSGSAGPTWIFDNLSGRIVSRCSSGTSGCAAVRAVSVSGTVRFDGRDLPDPGAARSALLPFSIAVAGTAPVCTTTPVDMADDRFTRYVCIVDLGTATSWSGRIELVPTGWTIGTGPADHRVCRYAAVAPAAHTGIAVALTHRDFLVVRGDVVCPAAILGTATAFVDRRTVPHQP